MRRKECLLVLCVLANVACHPESESWKITDVTSDCLLHLFLNPCWGVHTEPRQYNLCFIKQVNFLSGPLETSKCGILKPTEAKTNLHSKRSTPYMSLGLTIPLVPGEQWWHSEFNGAQNNDI